MTMGFNLRYVLPKKRPAGASSCLADADNPRFTIALKRKLVPATVRHSEPYAAIVLTSSLKARWGHYLELVGAVLVHGVLVETDYPIEGHGVILAYVLSG